MLFRIAYGIDASSRDDAQQRFKKTGGPPPEGVKMIGRWMSVAGDEGFVVAESDDAVAIGKWVQEWSDLLDFEVTPLLDDDGFTEVIG